jgi:hypothetical protein
MPEWLKQTTREVTCLLVLSVVLFLGASWFVLHAMRELLRLEMRWDILVPFLVGRGALGLALLYVLTMACRGYSRAVSLRAAALFGDSVTLSSAIAAHGGYSRNLILHSSQTTEEIAERELRSSPGNAQSNANGAAAR